MSGMAEEMEEEYNTQLNECEEEMARMREKNEELTRRVMDYEKVVSDYKLLKQDCLENGGN